MKRGKKLNNEIFTLRDDAKPGKTTQGKFLGIEPMLTQDGEPVQGNFGQDLYVLEMSDLKSGERNRYWADAGFRGTVKMTRVETGQPIEIVHTGQKEIEQGTVQTYDIFGLE